MKLEDELKQKTFGSEREKLFLNILFTAGWLDTIGQRFFKQYGITSQQYNILRILRGQSGKPATINLLQERMLDRMSNASRLVEKLKQKNLVERRECSLDRRQMDVSITSKGLELLKELDEKMPEMRKQWWENLSDEEARLANSIVEKLRG